jgi:hypothetical protein
MRFSRASRPPLPCGSKCRACPWTLCPSHRLSRGAWTAVTRTAQQSAMSYVEMPPLVLVKIAGPVETTEKDVSVMDALWSYGYTAAAAACRC